MVVHIALYKWKEGLSQAEIQKAAADVIALKKKVDGLIDIYTGENYSPWSEGYTHAFVVLAQDQSVLDAYRKHPDHVKVAQRIESMEDKSLGFDFKA